MRHVGETRNDRQEKVRNQAFVPRAGGETSLAKRSVAEHDARSAKHGRCVVGGVEQAWKMGGKCSAQACAIAILIPYSPASPIAFTFYLTSF